MSGLHKILVANRGEIAVRVIRTAKAHGYRTVAVYSEADTEAPHVKAADEAVYIGPSPAAESYLAAGKLLAAAELTGADAIHPGYGFLSENADFAVACEKSGITFIGPPAAAIDLMGSKRRSKIAMLEAGVPCIPGYEGANQDDDCFAAEAQRIGFPVMVKASAGGGGKGMRLVNSIRDLKDAIGMARSEARKAFGSDELILEKALTDARHIEIQVFADNHGNVVHLGERDCSIQRRHQKVVEEAPSPFVDEALRQRMGRAAVDAAKACAYRGAGTVEFLVDKDANFYFLEMNTRLQVEHPVTEQVTGLDLVAWQLQVAAGEPLPLAQEEITLTGHAMEVRLYAEDPCNDFLPQTGTVQLCRWPQTQGVRIDYGIAGGQAISAYYDPMLAKVIASGRNRDEARRRLACAVEDTVLLGVKSNKQFLASILRNEVFAAGESTTAFIEKEFANDASFKQRSPSITEFGIAAGLLLYGNAADPGAKDPLFGWRNTPATYAAMRLQHDNTGYELRVRVRADGRELLIDVEQDGNSAALRFLSIGIQRCTVVAGDVRRSVHYAFDGPRLYIDSGHGSTEFEDVTHRPRSAADAFGSGQVLAPMNGLIVQTLVTEGDRIEKGQTVVILESMKMELQLQADVSGIVTAVHTQEGAQVVARQLLVEITAADETCIDLYLDDDREVQEG